MARALVPVFEKYKGVIASFRNVKAMSRTICGVSEMSRNASGWWRAPVSEMSRRRDVSEKSRSVSTPYP